MEFYLTNFLASNWVNAIYQTLFHSLWVGIVMSLFASLIIVSTKKSSAALRYNLLTGLMGIFVLVMGVVFLNSLYRIETATQNVQIGEIQSFTTSALSEPSFLTALERTLKLLGTYANQIVLIWFCMLCVKAFQLSLGLHQAYYLKRNQIFDAGNYWKNKIDLLSNQLELNKKVSIFQSAITKVPVVIGHIKPIVLVPLGMLNSLPVEQVEAILRHELAHIKRADFFVNILQGIIEIVFFFNPAVIWVARLIKEERENCCDDLALSCTSNKEDYVKALVSFQEFSLNPSAYAIGLAGKKNQLLTRISRIIFNKHTTLNKMEKSVLTISLVLTVVFSIAFTNAKSGQSPVKEVAQVQLKLQQDTTKKKLKLAKEKAEKASTKLVLKKEIDASVKERLKEKGVILNDSDSTKVLRVREIRRADGNRFRVTDDARTALRINKDTVRLRINEIRKSNGAKDRLMLRTERDTAMYVVTKDRVKPREERVLNLKLHKDTSYVRNSAHRMNEVRIEARERRNFTREKPINIKLRTKLDSVNIISLPRSSNMGEHVREMKMDNSVREVKIHKLSDNKSDHHQSSNLMEKRDAIERRKEALKNELRKLDQESNKVNKEISKSEIKEVEIVKDKNVKETKKTKN